MTTDRIPFTEVMRINRILRRVDLRLCSCCQQPCSEDEFTPSAWKYGGACNRCKRIIHRVRAAVDPVYLEKHRAATRASLRRNAHIYRQYRAIERGRAL